MKSFAFLALLCTASAVGPIQKVLQLLGDIKSKVQAEGEVEAEQFDKYTKWCTEESSNSGYAIETGTNKKGELEAAVEQFSADMAASAADIEKLASAISANDADLASATKIRDAERKDFSVSEKELSEAIDQCARAAQVLRRAGLNTGAVRAALAQVTAGLSTVMDAAFIDVSSKRKLSALLEAASEDDLGGAPTAAAYESHSGGIFDTIAELKSKAESERTDLQKEEASKLHQYEMLKQSLTDQMNTQNDEMNKLKASKARQAEGLADSQGSLAETNNALSTDKKYLSDTQLGCQQKTSDFESRTKSRSEELAVIQQAIDILGKDNVTSAAARRLGFMQVKSSDDVRARVAALLQGAANKLHSIGLSQLAVRTRVGDDPFTKVRGLISDMINRLQKQAAEESDHKAYCDTEKAKSTAKRNKLAARHDELSARTDSAEAGIAKLKEEVATLSGEIAQMDSSFAEATALRTSENAEYKQQSDDCKVSSEAIAQAISVLQDYFSTQAAFVQGDFNGPVFSGARAKSTDAATGIIAMLEVAQSDLTKQMSEGEAEERSAASSFKKMKQESEVSKTEKETMIKGKRAEISRITNMLADVKSDTLGTLESLDAVVSYLDKLRGQCEHKPMTFEERTRRRESEIESLRNALQILDVDASGASLLQKSRRIRRS